jgi:hypothetical protein
MIAIAKGKIRNSGDETFKKTLWEDWFNPTNLVEPKNTD